MRGARYQIPSDRLAPAYGVSGRTIRHLYAVHGEDAVLQPDHLFHALVGNNQSPLRRKLTNPQTRESIRIQIQQLL